MSAYRRQVRRIRLIKPAHTDPESGYRYYSRNNLLRLKMILRLKDAGLSLPEIKEYLDGFRL
jgi:DNA-binding transcriptional MerR regulator